MEKKRLTSDKFVALLKEHPGTLHKKVEDILLSVSWRDFSNRYMGKKGGWIYEKFNGFDQYGDIVPPLTDEELTEFKNGLLDLSERIKKVAGSLQ